MAENVDCEIKRMAYTMGVFKPSMLFNIQYRNEQPTTSYSKQFFYDNAVQDKSFEQVELKLERTLS